MIHIEMSLQSELEEKLNELEEFLNYQETENALNELDGAVNIHALDVQNLLCAEVDNAEDLAVVSSKLKEIEYTTFL